MGGFPLLVIRYIRYSSSWPQQHQHRHPAYEKTPAKSLTFIDKVHGVVMSIYLVLKPVQQLFTKWFASTSSASKTCSKIRCLTNSHWNTCEPLQYAMFAMWWNRVQLISSLWISSQWCENANKQVFPATIQFSMIWKSPRCIWHMEWETPPNLARAPDLNRSRDVGSRIPKVSSIPKIPAIRKSAKSRFWINPWIKPLPYRS